ncbi:MAG TPA: MJ0042-type zinc finger domain-containing protein [Gemmata sp.]|nr:MJ0042-type zinc finger domain-containing protein [Gemmata sp.]
MLVVIRCPRCRAASRVEETDLGKTVQCPACADTFAAIEEAEVVAARPKSPLRPHSAKADGLSASILHLDPSAAPSSRPPRTSRIRHLFEPTLPTTEKDEEKKSRAEADTHKEFDPHDGNAASLPATVLVGLALLPFLIPILWMIAPSVLGREPVLSLGSGLALAVSTSAMCLAVIYTVDWRPSTRIRGVLLLVVLSYIAGIGLFVVKKDVVDRVRRFFGFSPGWSQFSPALGGYQVRVPGIALPVPPNTPQPLGAANLACHQATEEGLMGDNVFVIGSGTLKPGNANDPAPGTDQWFDKLVADIADRAAGTVLNSSSIKNRDAVPGRLIELQLGNGGPVRIVQVFYLDAKKRVYYASAEGHGMNSDDHSAMRFFDSFLITDAGK